MNFAIINIFNKTKNLEELLKIYKEEFLSFEKAFSIYKKNEIKFENPIFQTKDFKNQLNNQLKLLESSLDRVIFKEKEDNIVYLFQLEFENLKSNNIKQLKKFISSKEFYIPRYVTDDFINSNLDLLLDYINNSKKEQESLLLKLNNENEDDIFSQNITNLKNKIEDYILLQKKYNTQNLFLSKLESKVLSNINNNFSKLIDNAYCKIQDETIEFIRLLESNMFIKLPSYITEFGSYDITCNKEDISSFKLILEKNKLNLLKNKSLLSKNNYKKILINMDFFDVNIHVS